MASYPVTYWTRLQLSFSDLYTSLEAPRTARKVVASLLVIHSSLLAYSAFVHSPTLNEPAHLVAGISHWKFGRFDLYRVNPPLVRMVAALPVIAVGYHDDWTGFYEAPGARPEFPMGETFIAANGERSYFLLMIARWACIPFSWLGAVICYLWARDLYGRPAGALACTFWCFEPNILAHGSLITADVGGTALGLAACYAFWRWLKQSSWTQAAITGGVLGLAELAKTTLIIFYPIWPIMWFVYRWSRRESMAARDWCREVGMLVLQMTIGLLIINCGYGFEGTLTQLKEFPFVSDFFSGRTVVSSSSHEQAGLGTTQRAASLAGQPVQSSPLLTGTPSDSTRRGFPDDAPSISPGSLAKHNLVADNRFAHSWVGELPLPLPRNYILGIDLQEYDFEHYERPSYLHGEWQDRGWWYYYLYGCAIKIPLGLWVIGAFVLIFRVLRLVSFSPSQDSVDSGSLPRTCCERYKPIWGDEIVLLIPAVASFAVVSSNTGFSEHFRYVLPSFPFVFIAISQIARLICLTESKSEVGYTLFANSAWAVRIPILWTLVVSASVIWFVISSLWIYPHSLSYFNESVGGPRNGSKQLLGSNVDWGQDLRYLKWWVEHSQADSCLHLAVNTFLNPSDIGLASTLPWPRLGANGKWLIEELDHQQHLSANPFKEGGIYAISINVLEGLPCVARNGSGSEHYLLCDAESKSMFLDRLSELHCENIAYSIKAYQRAFGSSQQAVSAEKAAQP